MRNSQQQPIPAGSDASHQYDLAVVIVNYNVRYYVEQCLHSVERASAGLNVETWVVDNASSDDSVAYLQERFPHVHFIANEENVGFSRANNQAIRLTNSRYVLLLNPDTILSESTLHDCVAYMDDHSNIGGMGVSMYGANGEFALESRRSLPVPFTSFCKLTGLTALFPHSRLFGRYYMRFLDRRQPAAIEVISGAFNMLRSQALQQIGLLDETFFMYGEDIDLSYRLTLGGWDNYYYPSPIIHYKGESTRKDTIRYVNIFYEAMIIFMEKHFRHRYHHATLIFRLGIYLRAGLEYIKRFLNPLKRLIARTPPPERVMLMGHKNYCEAMRTKCQQAGYTVVEEGEVNHVIFSISDYSYEAMIAYMRDHYKQHPRTCLGTYNPATGIIILVDRVLA